MNKVKITHNRTIHSDFFQVNATKYSVALKGKVWRSIINLRNYPSQTFSCWKNFADDITERISALPISELVRSLGGYWNPDFQSRQSQRGSAKSLTMSLWIDFYSLTLISHLVSHMGHFILLICLYCIQNLIMPLLEFIFLRIKGTEE